VFFCLRDVHGGIEYTIQLHFGETVICLQGQIEICLGIASPEEVLAKARDGQGLRQVTLLGGNWPSDVSKPLTDEEALALLARLKTGRSARATWDHPNAQVTLVFKITDETIEVLRITLDPVR